MPSYLVIGASRGLGYAYVKTLAADPANTVFGSVRDLAATTARLTQDGIRNVHLVVADVTDPASLAAAASRVAALLPDGAGLDVLIHNAAAISVASESATILDPAPAALEDDLVWSFRGNVVGAAHTINAFLPLIRRGQGKKVVVLSSGMGDPDWVRQFDVAVAAPYSISKAAVNLLVAKYHATLGKKEGILFLAISPGVVDTSEGRPEAQKEMEKFRQLVPVFTDYAPGFKGPLRPEESVRMTLDVIGKATVETVGGDFISHHGTKVWL